MLEIYEVPIISAFLVFFVLAGIMTAPWTIYQYRKHGYFNFWRSLVIFSFIFYCLSAFFLVSLPMPKSRHNQPMLPNPWKMQLHPLIMFKEFGEVQGFYPKQLSTYPILFKSFTFLQVAFNVLLLFPLGVYLRYFFKTSKKWYLAIMIGFFVSLFFEVSQITALFGYFDYPYRHFDVDDIITNTLGTWLGFVLAPLILFFIPSREAIKEKDLHYEQSRLASYGAQVIECLLTYFIGKDLMSSLLQALLKTTDVTSELLGIFICLVILPYIFYGRTLGGLIVNVKLVSNGQRPSLLMLMKRLVLVAMPIFLIRILQWVQQFNNESPIVIMSTVFLFALFAITWLMIFITVLQQWIRRFNDPYFNRYVGIHGEFSHKQKAKK